MKLVIVGGAPYADDYIRQVWRAADPRVVFPGYVFGRGYWELQRHAYLFCAPTEVGGTHPVILEAMAAGNCVLVNDHRPNVETVGDAGVYFSGQAGVEDLASSSSGCSAIPSSSTSTASRALERARALLLGGGHRPVRGAAERGLRRAGPGSAAARRCSTGSRSRWAERSARRVTATPRLAISPARRAPGDAQLAACPAGARAS